MSLSCCCGCCCQKQTLCPPPEANLWQIFFINSWLPWCWAPSCRSGERSQQHLCLVCRGVRATCCTALQVSGKIKNDQEKADPPSLMYVSTGLMPATTTLTITWSSPTSGTGTLPSTWLNIFLTLNGPYGPSIWHALNLENFRPPKSLNSDSPHDGHVQRLLTKTIEAICAIMSISNNLRYQENFKKKICVIIRISNHLCSAIGLVLREPASLEKNLCTEVQLGGDWVQVGPVVREIDPLQDIETIIHLPCEQVVAELPCLR